MDKKNLRKAIGLTIVAIFSALSIVFIINEFINPIVDDSVNVEKVVEEYILQSTTLGSDKDMTIENFIDRDNFHKALRKSACELSEIYLINNSVLKEDCLELFNPNEYYHYSNNLMVSFPKNITLTPNKVNAKHFEVTVNLSFLVEQAYLLVSDSSSDGTIGIFESNPVQIKDIMIDVVKDDEGNWKIANSSNLRNKLQQLWCSWDGKGIFDVESGFNKIGEMNLADGNR